MITDPEVIRFSNEVIRPAADRLVGFFYFAESINDQINAKPKILDELLKGGEIEDGSKQDGRTTLTGEQIKLIITQIQAFVQEYRDKGSEKLMIVLPAAVNPR